MRGQKKPYYILGINERQKLRVIAIQFCEHKYYVLCATQQGYVRDVGSNEGKNATKYKLSECMSSFE